MLDHKQRDVRRFICVCVFATRCNRGTSKTYATIVRTQELQDQQLVVQLLVNIVLVSQSQRAQRQVGVKAISFLISVL